MCKLKSRRYQTDREGCDRCRDESSEEMITITTLTVEQVSGRYIK